MPFRSEQELLQQEGLAFPTYREAYHARFLANLTDEAKKEVGFVLGYV